MLEADYQAALIKRIKLRHPGVMIVKNDSGYLQGNLDLLILCGEHWAMLEVKASERSRERPNQRYYVDLYNEMSYASFIYPENEEAVLHDLQLLFRPHRKARDSQR